jgi:predicted acyl esterase
MPVRLAALAAALIALVLAAPAAAEPVPDGYEYSHEWFTAHDGVQLHAGVFLPADRKPDERHPTLLTITPYTAPSGGATGTGNTEGPVVRFPELFSQAKILKDRWAYVQVDVRGFGGSGGCFEYYGPNEVKDTKTTVDYLAARPWSTGRIGMVGKSYDAAQQVLALASRPKGLAASVIQAPGLSAYTALWMNRVHYATGRYATTPTYTADDLVPPQNPETLTSPEYATAASAALTSSPACRTDAVLGMNTVRDRDDPFWAGREPYLGAKGSTVPVLWSHGFHDANTKPEHMEIYEALAGPKYAWFGAYTHVRGHESGVGRKGFLEQSMRFLDRYVRGVAPPAEDPAVTVQEGNGKGAWRSETLWPPGDATPWAMPLRPGSYADQPGNVADGSGAGNGLWAVTKPLPHEAHLAGEPVLRAKISSAVPDVNVVALLYDIDEKGTAHFVQRGALAAPDAGEQEVAFKLYPQDWRFEKGHRIGVLLSGADDDWWTAGLSHTDVEVLGGTLSLPLLRTHRKANLAGGLSDAQRSAAPFAVDAETLAAAEVEGTPPPQEASSG